MAVTVGRIPHMVLDEDYRILRIGPEMEAALGPLAGRSLWETFPGSKPLFHPYYERARLSGESVEFVQFYNGHLARVRAVPDAQGLSLDWETLERLDTLTLDGLRNSLARAIAALDEHEARIERHRIRGGLRVIQGGER